MTRKSNIIIVFILSAFIFCSCGNQKEEEVDEKICQEILINKKDGQDVFIGDIAEEIKFVKLETTENSLFTMAQKVIVNPAGIFILDGVAIRKVFHFSLEGKFLGSIGNPGKGEGEYIMPIDFLINSKDNTIEIDDNVRNTTYIYDFNNNFIKKINHSEYRISAFNKFENGEYILKLGFNKGMKFEEYNFLHTKPDMSNVVNKLLTSLSESDYIYKLPFSNIQEDTIFFNFGFNDTIFQYSNSLLTTAYFINFGEFQLPKEMIKQGERTVMGMLLGEDYCGYVSDLFQNQNYLYFSFLSKKKNYLCFFNRLTGDKRIIANLVGLGNELYNRAPQAFYEESLVFVIDAYKVSSETIIQKTAQHQRFGVFESVEEIEKITNGSDNPIIMFIKPKDF